MAIGPIDYSTGVLDPLTRAMQGYAQRVEMGQRDRALGMEQQRIDLAQQAFAAEQQARAQREAMAAQEAESARAAEAAFAEYLLDPAKSYEKTVGVIRAYPQLAEAVMTQWQGLNADQQAGTKLFAQQLTYALGSGNVDGARMILEERAAAADAVGNAQEAATMRASLEALNMGETGVQTVLGMGMASLAGVLSAEEMAKHSELVFGPQSSLEDEKTRAEISKINAEAAKIAAEVAGQNKPDDAKRFDMEAKLRAEYVKNTESFTGVREAYRRVNASDESAAGDLSLIFAYMKMLDPASVVRETEFANAQNAAGVPDRIRNIWNKVLSGERLSADQRAEFKGQAEGLMRAASTREAEVRKGLEPTIAEYGLNAENIFSIGGDLGRDDDDAAFIAAMRAKRDRGEPPTEAELERINAILAKRGGQ